MGCVAVFSGFFGSCSLRVSEKLQVASRNADKISGMSRLVSSGWETLKILKTFRGTAYFSVLVVYKITPGGKAARKREKNLMKNHEIKHAHVCCCALKGSTKKLAESGRKQITSWWKMLKFVSLSLLSNTGRLHDVFDVQA